MEYGLYIHLPYCRSICPYCDFVKAPLHRADPGRLLAALEREWDLAKGVDGVTWSRPRTIYVGGGTPTALDPASLRHDVPDSAPILERPQVDVPGQGPALNPSSIRYSRSHFLQ